MNRWQDIPQEVVADLTQEWGKLNKKDLQSIEERLNQIVELIEKRYGYDNEKALAEFEHYVEQYGTRTRNALEEQIKALQKRSNLPLPLLWGVMAVVAVVLLFKYFRR